MVESKSSDKDYLDKVKRGLELIEKDNNSRKWIKESTDIWDILSKVCDYIDEQSGDLKNKKINYMFLINTIEFLDITMMKKYIQV